MFFCHFYHFFIIFASSGGIDAKWKKMMKNDKKWKKWKKMKKKWKKRGKLYFSIFGKIFAPLEEKMMKNDLKNDKKWLKP